MAQKIHIIKEIMGTLEEGELRLELCMYGALLSKNSEVNGVHIIA